VGIDIA
jgi:transposase